MVPQLAEWRACVATFQKITSSHQVTEGRMGLEKNIYSCNNEVPPKIELSITINRDFSL